jgi:hypothetical protein
MKKSIILALGILLSTTSAMASEINYTHTADLVSEATHIKLTDANYAILPTKTETRTIPGCNPNRKNGDTCTEVVVLESQPVIEANVYYDDARSGSGKNGQNHLYRSLYFKLTDFSDEQVATLMAAYPGWKHPFSNATKKFAANNLELTVSEEKRDIKIVDVRNSHLCRINKNGEKEEGCIEQIVYKDSFKYVQAVNVTVK